MAIQDPIHDILYRVGLRIPAAISSSVTELFLNAFAIGQFSTSDRGECVPYMGYGYDFEERLDRFVDTRKKLQTCFVIGLQSPGEPRENKKETY